MERSQPGTLFARRYGIFFHTTRNGEQTFEDYFKYIISRSLSDLDLAYEFKGSYTRITLFDKFSYQPIGAGLPLEIAGKMYKTDVNGAILVESLAINDAIFVSSYEKIFLDNFTLLSDTGKIYVATEPEGAEVEIYEGDDLVENFASPSYFNARYFADSTKYRIKIIPEGDYSEYETTVTLKRGYDVFVNQEFAKKTYGFMNIEPKTGLLGSSTLITIEDGYGKRLVDRSPEGFQGEAVSGRYTVRVEDDSLDEKYQVVEDSFILREDRKIEREYLAPIDREYSRGGTGFNWGFRFGRNIQSDTTVNNLGTDFTAAEYNNSVNNKSRYTDIDITSTSLSFFGALEKYTTNLVFGVEAEYLIGGTQSTGYYSGESEFTHSGFGGGVYAGIYDYWSDNRVASLIAGYSAMTVESDDTVQYPYEADLSSVFAEGRIFFGETFGLSLRYYPEIGSAALSFNFLGADITESYKYPASVEARQGKHY
ncbi:hypothetical protein FJM67_11475 [Maribrevibacterium harenarium]|uniref:Uncharacterized protein n=1 Tax=Maribrevibacterium harenarium TaxID=2589817 RepID=A0A501WNA5_9GAMM|nr:hypothetical protein [Maribrevibacterium harenarium]TPE49825.1 hypothetical protein FJM67_11475 [Maribrevibacterium harenarium]